MTDSRNPADETGAGAASEVGEPGRDEVPADAERPVEGVQSGAHGPYQRGELEDAAHASPMTTDDDLPPAPATARPKSRKLLFSGVVVLALLAGGLGAGYWARLELARVEQQVERLESGTNARLGALIAERERAQAEAAARAASRMSEVEQGVTQARGAIDSLSQHVARLNRTSPERLALAELEYLLQLANHRVLLEHDRGAGLQALEAAQARLEGLDEEPYASVRKQVGAEKAALEAVDPVDTADVAAMLTRLIARVDEMAIAQPDIVSGPGSASGEDHASGGWRSLLAAVTKNLGEFLIVRRADGSGAQTAIPDQAFFARQNLKLSYQSARVAALLRDTGNFRRALAEAQRWLAYFPADSALAAGMSSEVDRLNAIELAPRLPDVSGSLALVRHLSSAQALLETPPADDGASEGATPEADAEPATGAMVPGEAPSPASEQASEDPSENLSTGGSAPATAEMHDDEQTTEQGGAGQ